MILAAVSAVGTPAPCSVSGSFAATASAGTATSATRGITVPGGNSGRIRMDYVDVGTITATQVNLNGAGFSGSYSSGTIFAFTDEDTFAIRTTGDNAGESRTYTLTDADTGVVIANAVHTGA